VARRTRTPSSTSPGPPPAPASLKDVAAALGLSPTTISLVLNGSPGSEAIPPETQKKVFAAARKLNYHPNFLARALRSKRSYAVGVMGPELSDSYGALVVGGIEDTLLESGYMYLATSHHHIVPQITNMARLLWERSVEGLILVDTPYPINTPLPIVAVSGHHDHDGITNIALDHDAAAELGVGHLVALGHRRIAVMKGQPFSSDTEVRWLAIEAKARKYGVPIDPALIVQLEGDSPSPETGYAAALALVNRRIPFTALFAFNDVSAVGAIRALQDQGFQVPASVSVVGFDDTWGSAYHIPALTTVRQPLRRMGALAAQTLLDRIRQPEKDDYPRLIEVSPELIVRESTAPAPGSALAGTHSRARQ
jgi:DNA-binding LacI/PurR family transcriptional regulator